MARQRACDCGASLAGLRADAVYASEACAKRAKRADSADKARTRRPSRDGKGARVYLTFGEIVHIEQARDRLQLVPTPAGARLERKLALAADRITERAA